MHKIEHDAGCMCFLNYIYIYGEFWTHQKSLSKNYNKETEQNSR